MKNCSVAISGGAGFIGSTLANELFFHDGVKVKLFDNLSTGDWSRLSHDFEKVLIDISSASTKKLTTLLSGVDVLFHLSAVKLHNEKNTFKDLVQHNIVGTQKLMEAAGLAGVKTVVFSSSLYSYGMPQADLISESTQTLPTTIYGASKLFGESLVSIAARNHGFDFSIARLFFIYGEKQYSEGGYKSVIIKNFERLKSGMPAFINGDGKQILDYLHVSDCVSALIKLAEKSTGEIYNISSGIPLTITDLSKKMFEVSGVNKSAFAPPDSTAGTRRVGSNQKIKDVLGWSPKVSLEEGLGRTWRSLE